jgi:signal transduction histidine kinase/phage shock protein PspC (stress-responsive transcriptional regulator)
MARRRWACHHGADPDSATAARIVPEGATASTAQRKAREPAEPRRPGFLPLVRSSTNRVVSGVAGGLGERLGVDPILLRIAFAVLAVAGGAGVLLYLLAWALSVEPDAGAPPQPQRRPTGRQALALGCVVLGLLLLFRDVGLWFGDRVVWPVALAAAGSAVIWARSDDRERWTRVGARLPGGPVAAMFTGRTSLGRFVVGALLVAAGMSLVLAGSHSLAAAGSVVLAMAVTAAGLGLIVGPWTYRLARQVGEERRARIRSEARAEMAAHLHDSVLHTLALIQRADAPPEVVSLARRQERELRAWLYGAPAHPAGRLRPAVEAIATRVEQLHEVPVEVVVVGDAPLDERGRALVEACQEAAVNAARHSGAPLVSVYVEVEPDELTGYVRDQGKGFDPAAVPADRRGIADSIRGRMLRHGGSVTISSAPGEGTEVQLRMPRGGS